MILFLLIYIFAFLLIITCDKKYLFIPIVVISVLAGLRGNVGYDTCAYKKLYTSIGLLTYADLSYIEPSFYLFAWLCKLISKEPQFFLFIISVTQGVILFLVVRQVRNPRFFLLFFTALFYYPFFFSTIRQGLAMLILSFCYATYLRKGSLTSVSFVSFVAPTFHVAVLPVLILIKPIARLVLAILAVVLYVTFFRMHALDGLIVYKYFAKLSVVLSGGYFIDTGIRVAWHVYLSFALTQAVIILTAGRWRNVVIYSFLIVVMMVADLYLFRTARVAVTAMLCLCVLHCHNWHLYSSSVKIIILVYYCYFVLSMTVYPIVYGDERTLTVFAEQITTQAGNYHLWLFNDKNLCPY